MPTDFTALDATAQAELVRKGDVTSLELVDAAIARIETLDRKLNAVITPLFEKARRQAAAKLQPGPFRGVPFLLKDLIAASADDPLHSGMQLMKKLGFIAREETHLARKFREAGFIVIGKTNTPEIGLAATTEPAAYGPTRNPWNAERSTGGSSGGSAAAVAARIVPAAHGTDGGGSIRIPASECGIVGLKPSRGRVSFGPALGEGLGGLGIEGAMTISIRDTAGILQAISGPMPGDPYHAPSPQRPFPEELGRDAGRLRVGLMTINPGQAGKPHVECVRAVERTGRVLESLGHRVEIAHPRALDEPEFAATFAEVLCTYAAQTLDVIGQGLGHPVAADEVEPYTWSLAVEGRKVSASRYITARDWLHAWGRRMASWWTDEHDLLVTPTIAELPPRLGDLGGPGDPLAKWQRNREFLRFTSPCNASGQPAISLPLHWTPDGLPVGVHFIAAYGREDVLIRIAAQLEQAEPWANRRPPIAGVGARKGSELS